MADYTFIYVCSNCRHGLFILTDAVFAFNNNNGRIIAYMVYKPRLVDSAVVIRGKVLCNCCYTPIGRITAVQGHVLIFANTLQRVEMKN